MTEEEIIEAFLAGSPFAVVGASQDRTKYGNKCLRTFQQNDCKVYPINPKGGTIEGLKAYASLSKAPESIHGISIITPPLITEAVVKEAIDLGIKYIWIQPGAESDDAIAAAKEAGLHVISGGACLLVVMRFMRD